MASNSNSKDESFLQNEGLLDKNEHFETVYLAEDEIEKFMEQYLKENPGIEVETRYLKRPPVEVKQNIEVRWLRPKTPELSPIIIKEVDVIEKIPTKSIRIVQKPKPEEKKEPLIFREKPKPLPKFEPKIVYVKNRNSFTESNFEPSPLSKPNNDKHTSTNGNREIKIEHVRSESQNRLLKKDNSFTNNSKSTSKISRLEFDEKIKTDKTFFREIPQFENQSSTFRDPADEQYQSRQKLYGSQRTIEEERQLKLYEEKLMQTLHEEYLLRLEREKNERKLQEEGVFEERLREKSMSQERLSQLRKSQNRLSQSRLSLSAQQGHLNREEIKGQLFRDTIVLLREQQLREEEHLKQRILEQQLIEEKIRNQRLSKQDHLRPDSINDNLINTLTSNEFDRSISETSTYKSVNV